MYVIRVRQMDFLELLLGSDFLLMRFVFPTNFTKYRTPYRVSLHCLYSGIKNKKFGLYDYDLFTSTEYEVTLRVTCVLIDVGSSYTVCENNDSKTICYKTVMLSVCLESLVR